MLKHRVSLFQCADSDDANGPFRRDVTGALLDRLTHHVHILEMNGESYRLKNSQRKKDPEQQ